VFAFADDSMVILGAYVVFGVVLGLVYAGDRAAAPGSLPSVAGRWRLRLLRDASADRGGPSASPASLALTVSSRYMRWLYLYFVPIIAALFVVLGCVDLGPARRAAHWRRRGGHPHSACEEL